ncbi:MAG: hypothetical protein RIR25_703, partial [Verrucomicrobiota bacterium]
TGKKVTISGISRLILQVSASGPKKWSILYAETNANSAFDPNPLRSYGPFDVTNPTNSGVVTNTDITALVSNAISSNPITLTAGRMGYFRLVGFGGTSSFGTGRIVATNDLGALDFALTGTVEEMPKTSQTISFPAFGRQILGDDPLSPASASSGLTVSYVSSDPSVAQVSNNSLILKKVGTSTITASQAGNADYYAASDVSQILTVSQPVPSDYLTNRYAVFTNNGNFYRSTNDYKGTLTNLAFDLYRRTNTSVATPQPVVIMIHGGGYNASSAGRDQSYIVSLGNQLAARGFQALSIDYRLRADADRDTDAEQLPALRDAAADALEAVNFVRTNATNYGWDTNAIFVLGGSAGGRIAAWLAVRESGDQGGLPTTDTNSTTSPPSSVTSDANAVYNRSNMVASAVLFGGPELSFRAYTVNSSDLPCIMIHGTYDGNTDQTGSIDTYGSVELYKQLIAVGVPAELHFLNGYGHQFDTSAGAWASVDAIPTAADLTVRFFIKEWERKLAGGTETFSPAAVSQAGASLTLTAPVATQSAPGTTYQWKKDGTSLAGQTAATLLLDPLSASDNGSYTVAVGNPNETWSKTEVSLLSFSNTPMSRVNYVKAGLKLVSSHPSSLTLAVATVAVPAPTPTPTPSPTPSFASAYPGESATSDEDGDGWVALAEYAFGWSRAQGSEGKSAIFPQTAVENQWLVLNYQVRTNDPKLVVTAETGTDLSDTNPLSWNSEGVSNSVLGPVTIGAEILERRAASVPMDAPKRFLRLRFLQDP